MGSSRSLDRELRKLQLVCHYSTTDNPENWETKREEKVQGQLTCSSGKAWPMVEKGVLLELGDGKPGEFFNKAI